MFTSKRVPCYLNSFSGIGETDAKELRLIFHVSPITQDLAAEVSPYLADRLFRRNIEGAWEPAREITKASFASVSVPMQNVTFFSLPEAELGDSSPVLVPGAAISNLRAQRAFSDGLDFRLEFDAVIPMDETTMDLVEKYYKATCFLTMEPVQREMEYSGEEPSTEHQNALQDAADAEPHGEDSPGEEAPKRKRSKKEKETVSA